MNAEILTMEQERVVTDMMAPAERIAQCRALSDRARAAGLSLSPELLCSLLHLLDEGTDIGRALGDSFDSIDDSVATASGERMPPALYLASLVGSVSDWGGKMDLLYDIYEADLTFATSRGRNFSDVLANAVLMAPEAEVFERACAEALPWFDVYEDERSEQDCNWMEPQSVPTEASLRRAWEAQRGAVLERS